MHARCVCVYIYTLAFSSADARIYFSFGHILKSQSLKTLVFNYLKPYDFIVHLITDFFKLYDLKVCLH